jgi:hypothetical protein
MIVAIVVVVAVVTVPVVLVLKFTWSGQSRVGRNRRVSS